jgi:hypothetical protein
VTVKRQHEPQRIIGDLLTAEISESEPLAAIGPRTMANARPIKYQMTIAKLPLAKEIEEFDFEGRPEGRHRFKPDGRRGQRDPDPGSGDR